MNHACHAGKAIINVGQHQVIDLKWLAQRPQPALMAFGFPVASVVDQAASEWWRRCKQATGSCRSEQTRLRVSCTAAACSNSQPGALALGLPSLFPKDRLRNTTRTSSIKQSKHMGRTIMTPSSPDLHGSPRISGGHEPSEEDLFINHPKDWGR